MSRKYRITEQSEENGYPEYEVIMDDKICPYCRSDQIHVNSSITKRKFNDIDENGNFRTVNIQFPRYKCRECNKTWSPLPKNLNFSYTPEFKNHIIDLYFNSDMSIQELSRKFHFKEPNIRKFLRDYNNEWNLKRIYRIPSKTGLFRIDTPAGELFGLVDISLGSLLDIMNEKELEKIDFKKANRVYLAGLDIPDHIIDNIGRDKIVFPDSFRLEDGFEALEKDATRRKIELDNLRELLENADVNTPYEQIIKFPALMPIIIAAKNLIQFNRKETDLNPPDMDLKNYLDFFLSVNRLKKTDMRSDIDREESDYFIEMIKHYKKKIGKLNKKYNTVDKVRGKLLFGENTQAMLKDPSSGEIIINFGKRLEND